ncbi:hypothetical protein HG531_012995 [Fusarium graminearum]|nr:hypothetical protein HG531_012995 [Fusarium graminearum]
MNTSKCRHAAEPEAEEAVCPALVLKNLKSKKRVVVDGVDHHLHQVNTIALDLDILVGQNGHGNVDESLNAAVDLPLQAKHHGLSQLTSAYSLDSSLNTVGEHVSDHGEKSLSSWQHVLEFAIVSNLALLLEKLANDPHISVSELLAKSHSEGSEFGGKNLNEVLHDVRKRVDIGLRLESERGGDTDREGFVGHTVQNVSINGKKVVLVLEVELLKLLDGVTSTSTEITLSAGEVRENVTDKEVFNLVRNGTLFAQNDGGQSGDHAQRTLLGNVVLLVIFNLFVFVDNGVDKLENLESLLATVLGEVDKEIRGSNVGSRGFFKVVELSVKILVGLVLELLDILLGEAKDREDEMSNQVGEEDKSIRKTRPAEPRGFGDPFLDLLEIVLEDFGSNVRGEVFSESKRFLALAWAGRVAMSESTVLV